MFHIIMTQFVISSNLNDSYVMQNAQRFPLRDRNLLSSDVKTTKSPVFQMITCFTKRKTACPNQTPLPSLKQKLSILYLFFCAHDCNYTILRARFRFSYCYLCATFLQ